MYSEADFEIMAQLRKVEPFIGIRTQTPAGEPCKVRILGRGEMAYYEQSGRSLLMEVAAGHGVAVAKSIRWWDDRKKVTDEEREVVVAVMSEIMRQLGFNEVRVVGT